MTLASVSPQAAPATKRQPGQILDAEQARAIHRRYAAGESRDALAAEYRVSSATVRGIIRGDTWKSLGLPKLVERFEDRRVDLKHTAAGKLDADDLQQRIGAIDAQIEALQQQIKALRAERKPLSAALTWARTKAKASPVVSQVEQPSKAAKPSKAHSTPKPLIYFAQRSDGSIRIGMTRRDLRKYLQTLARQAESTITLLGTLEGFADAPAAMNQLRCLLRQFADYRREGAGDWHVDSSPLVQFIRRSTRKPSGVKTIPAPSHARRLVDLLPASDAARFRTRLQELLAATIARLPAAEATRAKLVCVIDVDPDALTAALAGASPYVTLTTARKFARWLNVPVTEIAAVSDDLARAYFRSLPNERHCSKCD